MKRAQYEILAGLASGEDARVDYTPGYGWELFGEPVDRRSLEALEEAGFVVQDGRAWFSSFRGTDAGFAAIGGCCVSGD